MVPTVVAAPLAAEYVVFAGVASFTTAMLTEGTTTKNSDQLADAMQLLGTRISAGVGDESGAISFTAQSDKLQQALDLIAAVGSSNLWLQYDIYHMQVMEGDLANTIEKNLAKIAHMQLADNPGRHEPGTGEINYDFLFKHIDKLGYQGWIGCEYKPAGETTAGLGWVKPYLK